MSEERERELTESCGEVTRRSLAQRPRSAAPAGTADGAGARGGDVTLQADVTYVIHTATVRRSARMR